jgi:hypothetical protein
LSRSSIRAHSNAGPVLTDQREDRVCRRRLRRAGHYGIGRRAGEQAVGRGTLESRITVNKAMPHAAVVSIIVGWGAIIGRIARWRFLGGRKMFGLRRFRFRSPERDRQTAGRRLALIQRVVCSAVAEAESESKGLRARVAKTQRSVMSLLAQVQDVEIDPACCAELANLELSLVAGQQNLVRLEHHLLALRKLELRIDRLIDQTQVAALKLPN